MDEQSRVRLAVEPGISPVQIDYGRLRQVFQSRIENAIQHSPYGAPVIIEAREISENDCDWLECIVKDCGAGLLSAAYAIKTQRGHCSFDRSRNSGHGSGSQTARCRCDPSQTAAAAGGRASCVWIDGEEIRERMSKGLFKTIFEQGNLLLSSDQSSRCADTSDASTRLN